ncbi:MAG: hypothetical protein GX434_13595 [Peptococcaceae bacterium]|nr:hypothetical protein [Peptococcaceae bacterium]
MQIDIHHSGIYVICRISGMKSKFAEIVAYASQYVDDAVFKYALKFKNGGYFKQVQTAHKLLSPKNFDFDEALEIWMPFHFLPKGGDSSDGLVTAPDSKIMALLLEDIRCSSPSHLLYRLGIGLHCFADAFSHQDFMGFNDSYNDVHLIQSVEEKGNKENPGRLSLRLLDRWSSDSMSMGHGEVLNNPDLPYAEWAYSRGSKTFRIRNTEERYLPALKNIYDYLNYFLGKNSQYCAHFKIRAFEDYLEKFRWILSFKGSPEERHRNWLKKIKENYFEFADFDDTDRNIGYDEKRWFSQAVEAIKVSKATHHHYQKYDYHMFRKKDGFEDSDWVKFMQAAAEHQFLIIHCLLPESGLIIG